MIQDEVGFLCLPPAFAAVPQYFIHFTVALLSLSKPDKRLSHIRLPDKSFRTIRLATRTPNPVALFVSKLSKQARRLSTS